MPISHRLSLVETHKPSEFEIRLLGGLCVIRNGVEVPLPASKKARALLAFLIETGRPHRRDRICEIFWDLPNDPKAALRWALTKLRKVIDSPERARIVADRERVSVDTDGLYIDIQVAYDRLRGTANKLSVAELEDLARSLDAQLLGGLDDAGDDAFQVWLDAARHDARSALLEVWRRLVTHPDIDTIAARKWRRLLEAADPEGAAKAQQQLSDSSPSNLGTTDEDCLRAPSANATQHFLRNQHIGFCDATDGTKIAYATIGNGPPLLKAANWLTHLEFDWTSPIWGECFSEIASTRTLVRYDERGCGLSDWTVKDLGFEAFVEDLEVVADKLQLQRFPLLGISQGAAVCIEYAVRLPERVSGLILLGSYAAGWRHINCPEELARREAVRALTEVGWGTDNPAYRHIFSRTFMPDAKPEELNWFDEFQRLTTSARNAACFQDAFGDIDVRHRLSSVRAPTIVLHSRGDQRIPLAVGRAVAAGIPNARFVPLESSNHVLVSYEPAWRTFMNVLQDFLACHDI